jgi:hypothetical protein
MEERYPPINIKFNDRKRYYDHFIDFHLNNSNSQMLLEMIKKYISVKMIWKLLKHYIS